MTVLQIKSQGFPSLVNDLGVQSPLAGPFWGLETTVLPTYIIGASAPVPATSAPYPFINFAHGNALNPLAGAVIVRTEALPRGRYNLEIHYWFTNGSITETTFLVFQALDAAGGTAQLWQFDICTDTTRPRPVGVGKLEMSYDNTIPNGFFDVETSGQLTQGRIVATIRWVKTSELSNF